MNLYIYMVTSSHKRILRKLIIWALVGCCPLQASLSAFRLVRRQLSFYFEFILLFCDYCDFAIFYFFLIIYLIK